MLDELNAEAFCAIDLNHDLTLKYLEKVRLCLRVRVLRFGWYIRWKGLCCIILLSPISGGSELYPV